MRATWSDNTAAGGRPRNRWRLAAALTMMLAGLIGAGVLSAATASAQETNYVIATDTTFAPFEFQDAGGE